MHTIREFDPRHLPSRVSHAAREPLFQTIDGDVRLVDLRDDQETLCLGEITDIWPATNANIGIYRPVGDDCLVGEDVTRGTFFLDILAVLANLSPFGDFINFLREVADDLIIFGLFLREVKWRG